MSQTPEIPIEQVKDSAVKFDLCNLRLELNGMLEKLKGDSDALGQLRELLSDTLEKCSQAITESNPTKDKQRRIPHD
jgi:hypothetical protein